MTAMAAANIGRLSLADLEAVGLDAQRGKQILSDFTAILNDPSFASAPEVRHAPAYLVAFPPACSFDKVFGASPPLCCSLRRIACLGHNYLPSSTYQVVQCLDTHFSGWLPRGTTVAPRAAVHSYKSLKSVLVLLQRAGMERGVEARALPRRPLPATPAAVPNRLQRLGPRTAGG